MVNKNLIDNPPFGPLKTSSLLRGTAAVCSKKPVADEESIVSFFVISLVHTHGPVCE